ncbi:uncharacterized protein PgNI_08099 [Pyricularia grisea]|uniref:Uncharacterized protein n=1 Tax=Pyricularia grisea TaxID=148305 RepID=A0A6P8AUF3_PYRGI|nr:uncharacterized protein PgNI_08099 [Pyricularia grisea]TLD05853.1 hypothetical protein PgNI_08099 [Pyricularia grisea]
MPNWSPPQPVVLPPPCRTHAHIVLIQFRRRLCAYGDQWGFDSIVSRLTEMPPQMTGRI